LRAPLLDGVHTKKIREREQTLAPQKLQLQKFSSHLPGREDARKISAIVGKRYRRIPSSAHTVIGAYRRPAPCACLVTIATYMSIVTYMLAETVYFLFVELARVADAGGVRIGIDVNDSLKKKK